MGESSRAMIERREPTRRTQPVRLIVFPGGNNWPIWVAHEKGWLASNGIELEVTPTPGSVFQLTGLIDGKFDLAITLIDNVVAYREGQGEVPVVGPDLVALMSADTRIFPTLITLPEIQTYADLRGRTLSVDALTTGYAFVLIAMLERAGLGRGDYRLEPLGGALERFRAMRERRHAGALFNSPFEGLLRSEGYTVLDTAVDALGTYEGMVLAGRRPWAHANRPAVVGFIRAFRAAVDWLYDPANQEEAFTIYAANASGGSVEAARVAYSVLFDADNGFVRGGEVDLDRVRRVLSLRSAYGRPKKTLIDPLAYVEASFVADARKA
jgi:ABC-type nitrate/sulfonate/bicarbonate transport system substrate-binding protein